MQIFNIKRASFKSRSRKNIHLPGQLWVKILLVLFDFECFCRSLWRWLTPDIRYNISRMQKLPDVSVMSKSTFCKWFRKLGFCYLRQVHQRFNVEFIIPGCNYIKDKTAARLFYCEFFKIFKKTYFSKYPQRAASNDIIFVNSIVHWNGK